MKIRSSRAAAGATLSLALGSAVLVATTHPADAVPHPVVSPRYSQKSATSIGYGGAVSTVDPEASYAALQVLKKGGNATDAAIAAAAVLGVTEPYSSGIGGGGFLVHYDAKTGKVQTIDGRETAPASMPHDAFIDPGTGRPYNFTPELVTSGVSVGTPGSLATWHTALDRWGTMSLGDTFQRAIEVADRGFVVDPTFYQQTLENQARFAAFWSTRHLFLPGGQAPEVGSTFKNPALAETYRLIAKHGIKNFYSGALGRQIAQVAQHPPKTPSTTLPVPPGYLKASDLKKYATVNRAPTHVGYRGYTVYGMRPSSSGGSTVGEALNIMERFDLSAMSGPDALHHYLDASALAFADRGAYVGDPGFVSVPVHGLLDDKFAAERACQISDTTALKTPVAAGDPYGYDGVCGSPSSTPASTAPDTENLNTTNMTVVDKWGDIVEYTLTIEQTGGSGIVVPGRGFLLNNELTDFSAVYNPADPNRIEAGKRPRSSISPTIVLKDGKPFLALGSPGGSTIITTVLQMLFNRLDRGMTIEQAIAAPRASQRNTASVTAEQSFIDQFGATLKPYGYTFSPAGAPGATAAEIGAATAVEFGPGHLLTAVSEPTRRGGGSALVVKPKP